MRRPPVIGLVVALVLALAFYFLLYKPANEEQEAFEAETATLEQQQQALDNQIAQLRDIEARQVEINAAKARLEEYIPEGPGLPSAIRQFQRAADAAGTDIGSVTFGEPSIPDPATGAVPGDTGDPATTLANIPITMVVNGGYFRVVDFFRRLEVETPRAFLVQTVAVAEHPDARFPTLEVTWTGQMFAVLSASEVQAGGGTVAPVPGATPAPTPSPAGGN